MKKVVVLIMCFFSIQAFAQLENDSLEQKVISQISNEAASYNLSVKDYLLNELSISNFMEKVNDLTAEDDIELIATRLDLHMGTNSQMMSEYKKVVILKLNDALK